MSAADAAGRYSSVLHLGIGGSDWGPRLITRALRHGGARREVRFASNVDSHSVADAMSRLDPHDTLVIVASKSFTTTEPLANAEVAMNWLRDAGVADPIKQVVAITANVEAALNLGISPTISSRSGTAGGRYSLWSAIGSPVALALGNDTFDQLLAGAAAMDEHFRNAPAAENAPLQLALAGVVNRNVLGYDSLVISPHDSRLHHLVPRRSSWKWNRWARSPRPTAVPSACRPGLLSGACRARTASIHSFNGCTRTPPARRWISSRASSQITPMRAITNC